MYHALGFLPATPHITTGCGAGAVLPLLTAGLFAGVYPLTLHTMSAHVLGRIAMTLSFARCAAPRRPFELAANRNRSKTYYKGVISC